MTTAMIEQPRRNDIRTMVALLAYARHIRISCHKSARCCHFTLSTQEVSTRSNQMFTAHAIGTGIVIVSEPLFACGSVMFLVMAIVTSVRERFAESTVL